MKVTLWGTRGSLASPGADTARYGGNTSCVEVRADDGTVLILDAGTGIRQLGSGLPDSLRRIDLLLTHLHMDHVQGLGFFRPLYNPKLEVHLWGPASTTASLRLRLMRYLSPPLFPVHLRDLPCQLHLHQVACDTFTVGGCEIASALVCHPGPTVGYRITTSRGTLAYLPDHEPALGVPTFPIGAEWTSGYGLAADADLLIHDAQYSSAEYPDHVGWGHSSIDHALAFAALSRVSSLVPFHHDPGHSDDALDRMTAAAELRPHHFRILPGSEGSTYDIGAAADPRHS